ncbi:MAG: hypothetical protein Q8O88_00750 [bacterium]|nr:hypothetical protein [bacterium]
MKIKPFDRWCQRCKERNNTKQCVFCGNPTFSEGELIDHAETMLGDR